MYSFKDRLNKEGFTVDAIVALKPSPKAKDFRIICEKNECANYGTNWGCPPGVGTLKEAAERLKPYSEAFLIRKKYVLDSKDLKAVMMAADDIADSSRRAADMIRHFAPVKVLGCGKCHYCGICTYPDDECRYPLQRMDSVSGYGLDIDGILEQMGDKLVFEADSVTLNNIILIGGARS